VFDNCCVWQHKEVLLACEGFIPLLVDSLLLDPEHPRKDNASRMGETDWEAAKGPVQRVRHSRPPVHLMRCSFARSV
jgi:hypothetical protein